MADSIKKEKYLTKYLVKDIYPFLKPYRFKFFLASVIRVLGDLAWLYPAYAIASLVGILTTRQPVDSLRQIWIILFLYAGVIIVRTISQYAARRIAFKVADQVALDAETAAVEHIFKLDIGWHESENTGNKVKKISRGSDSISMIFRIWINNILEIAVNFIGIIFIISKFDMAIALLTFIFLATYYAIAYFFRKRASQAAIIVNAKEEDVHGLIFESVNNIRSVKVMGMARALVDILKKEQKDLFDKITKRVFWFQSGNSIRDLCAQLFRVGIMAFIIYGIINGHYQVGFLVLFLFYFNTILMSVSEFASITQDFVISRVAIGRMMQIMHEEVKIDEEIGKVSFPNDWKKISLNKVSFSYGDNIVLKDISFDIKRGERVGIVGLSGAGKSTLFKLLLKEHESYSGEILFDGVPLKSISKQDYFRHTGAVLQDTEVFNFSLKQNIVLANIDEENNSELLQRALNVSHVEDFVKKLPNGVETLIGEKGIKLSGGERQRVGLARAIFKNPQILLLDEATSHLDIESEEKIRSSLHEFFQTVTAVVIAHRLTTIKEMDRIIVIEYGKIIEEGSFDELYTKKGRFFELWEKQKL